jgi:hypothetical protein
MKDFHFSSAVNPLAARRALINLQGHRVPLPGASSFEPMLRGCNQREWLDELVRMGLRHLIVPLNGPEEDTCLFARRHPGWASTASLPKLDLNEPKPDELPTRPAKPKARTSEVLYDLQHRDEGTFTRLQFLLNAAESIGVMVGFTLFNAWPATEPGPLHRGGNVQGIALEDLEKPGQKQPSGERLESLEKALAPCVDWIAAEIRGRSTVWVQIFRGLPDVDPGLENAFDPLRKIETNLTRKLAAALSRPGENQAKARSGPWVVTPEDFNWETANASHRAPFDMRRVLLVDNQNIGRVCGTGNIFKRSDPPELAREDQRRPAICSFVMSDREELKSARRFTQARLWRSAITGGWPIVPGGFEKGGKRRWFFSAKMAEFFKQWAGKGYLRACPEILAPMPYGQRSTPSAGTDGSGRFFVFFEETPKRGIELSVPPGCYRFYWLDPTNGRAMDIGDGLPGGDHCRIPEVVTEMPALLVVEQEELPDPLSVW